MVVIDTSVAFKWFNQDEENHELAMYLLKNHLSKKNKIITHDLMTYELVNAWATKSALNENTIKANISLLQRYRLVKEQLITVQLKEIVHISRKYKVSGYDASYAVLAKSLKCNLITADEKFVKKVNLPFVKLLGN